MVEKGVVPAAVAEIRLDSHQQLFHWHTSYYERVSFPVLSKHKKSKIIKHFIAILLAKRCCLDEENGTVSVL